MKQYLFIDPKTIVLRDRFVNAFRMDAQDLEKHTGKPIDEVVSDGRQ